jgi:hypothetical protein
LHVSVAILGSDAILAARPASPIQLLHAARLAGFDAVLPASLGDELVAAEALRLAQAKGRTPVFLCACPLVGSGTCGGLDALAVPVAPPPVALARAVRLESARAPVHITYIGDCPGAVDPAIDLRVPGEAFLRGLAQRGIDPAAQPTEFTDRLPPDRRRFRSIAGGAPVADAVEALLRRTLVVPVPRPHADPRLQLADALLAGGATFIDPAPLFGCACAGTASVASSHAATGAPAPAHATVDALAGRTALAALEPPRAAAPVISADPALDLRPTRAIVESAPPMRRTPQAITAVEAAPAAHAPRTTASATPVTGARARFALAAQVRRRHTPVAPAAPVPPPPAVALEAAPVEREVPLVAHDADATERATPLVPFYAGVVTPRATE